MENLFIDKYVVVRTYSAGVHVGVLKAKEGKEVILSNSRRLWYWEKAFTLSAVATKGIGGDSKISVPVTNIQLTEAIEIIPCTPEAEENLRNFKEHVA